MKNYISLQIKGTDPELTGMLVAELTRLGFQGFEERETELLAYCEEDRYESTAVASLLAERGVSYLETLVKEQNWNAVWEENFQPVCVEDFVAIRADFHLPVPGVGLEIIIVPKMSFGTGHHATTYLMIRQMRELDFREQTVLDFGTGTGILAILAEKMEAGKITAIDLDDWSILNARENIAKNNCHKISVIQAASLLPGETYDRILANITRDVILENLPGMARALNPGGILLLSGLLLENEAEILAAAQINFLKMKQIARRDQWISILLGN